MVVAIMKKLLGIVVLGLLLSSNNVLAGSITVSDYLKFINSDSKEMKQHMNIVLIHIEQGFATANVELEYTKKDKIYCQPVKLNLNAANLTKFLNDEIKFIKKNGHNIDDFPIAMILMRHLKKQFPCKQ
tara:strand:+ start:98 stop:484 length:387 start_codon:yes stop_codon:yes gene_type:complete